MLRLREDFVKSEMNTIESQEIIDEESLNGETLYTYRGVRYIVTYTADKKYGPDDISECRSLVGTLRKQGLDNEFPSQEVVTAFNAMLSLSNKGKLVGARIDRDRKRVEYDGPPPVLNEDEFLIQMEVT